MIRATALCLTLLFMIVFLFMAYFGAKITFYSSFTFAIFVSLILLNMFYPLSNLVMDYADFTLVLYAAFQVIGIIILSVIFCLRR